MAGPAASLRRPTIDQDPLRPRRASGIEGPGRPLGALPGEPDAGAQKRVLDARTARSASIGCGRPRREIRMPQAE
jgi:hypothetical protein